MHYFQAPGTMPPLLVAFLRNIVWLLVFEKVAALLQGATLFFMTVLCRTCEDKLYRIDKTTQTSKWYFILCSVGLSTKGSMPPIDLAFVFSKTRQLLFAFLNFLPLCLQTIPRWFDDGSWRCTWGMWTTLTKYSEQMGRNYLTFQNKESNHSSSRCGAFHLV